MLDDIVKNNRYPIVFVGSGISKRYIEKYPTWSELLEEYWGIIGEKENFYSFMRSTELDHSEPDDTNAIKSFRANTLTAEYIQQKFDDLFFDKKISVVGLSIKKAYTKHISPFKFDLANKFRDFVIKNDMKDEVKKFVTFLSKAKVIVTTNYDPFIEYLLANFGTPPTVFVGQQGFFDQTNDWAELYKIHGDVSDPNSIVITKSDYDKYDKNSILISAKILVNMIESPIIFLGYSLSDRNVRTLLTDFASQLPKEDIRKTVNRITLVEYSPTQTGIVEEMMRDQSLDIGYSLIRTDEYGEIYTKLSEINEGLSPHEVLKYQKAIKNIVLSAGSKGVLDTVLVSPEQMNDLEDQIKEGKNIVVALGNKKNIFVFPDILSYIHDYLFELNEFLPSVALTFVAKDGNRKTKTPFVRYLNEVDVRSLGLDNDLIEKINNKIKECPSLNSLIEDLSSSYKVEHYSLEEILKKDYNNTKLINVIIYNIHRLDQDELTTYIKETSFAEFSTSVREKSGLKSSLRKLFYAYDLLIHGEPKAIEIKKPSNPN